MNDPQPLEYEPALHLIEELNPSVYVLAKAERKIRDPEVEVDDIINILKNDPAITADIIHVSNSAYYGATIQFTDIRAAISQIGFRELLKIISLCITKDLLAKPLDYYGMTESDCLGESITIALLIDSLSESLNYDGQEAYTVGLLSTVGKTVINQALEMNEHDGAYDDGPLTEWEDSVIGFNHARAGAMLLKAWEFPVTMISAILNQFSPDESEGNEAYCNIPRALCFVRYVTDKLGIGLAVEEIEFDDVIASFLSDNEMTKEKLELHIATARERFGTISSELGIKRS